MTRHGFCSIAVSLWFSATTIFAGIPEPGIVLYGVVQRQSDSTRIIHGQIVWTYSNAVSGVVSVTNALQDIDGIYSYAIRIPFETAVTNDPVNADALALTAGNSVYSRHARINGVQADIISPAGISDTNSIAIRGAIRRVDLQVDIGVTDTDGDGIPDWWEELYFGGSTSANADAQAASGQYTIREAWIADLNPTNPASTFPLVAVTNLPSGTMTIVVSPSSTERMYSVRWTTNLTATPQVWALYPSEKMGVGGPLHFIVTNDAPGRVYRTGVRLP